MSFLKKNQFTLSVFVTGDGLSDLQTKGHRQRITEFFKYLEIDKVYLATVGDGHVDSRTVKEIKTHFEKNRFIVSGGQIPLRFMKGMFDEQIDFAGRKLGKPCLSDSRNRKLIEKSFTDVAKYFDEYILDDHFYLDCYCDRCIELFNQQYKQNVTRESLVKMILNSEQRALVVDDFIKFRENQLLDCIENLCVKPSRKINPKIRLVFKVAEWYERYKIRGIDISKVSRYFDHVCIGTESRELTERYGSYFLIRYNKSLCGAKKVDRAWIDDLGGYNFKMPLEPGAYKDLARNSVLAGIQELILWCYPTIFQPDRQKTMKQFKSVIPELREIHSIVHKSKPHALSVLVPHNAKTLFSPETYLADLLGGLGIPLEPVQEKNLHKVKSLLLPVHGILPESKQPIINFVKKGGTLLLTSESARILARNSWGKNGLDLLGITENSAGIGSEKSAQITAFVSTRDIKTLHPINHRRCSSVPIRPVYQLKSAKPILYGLCEEQYIPVIFENKFGKGKIITSCITEYPPYIKTYYPEIVRDTIREILYQQIGIRTKSTGYSACSFGNFVEPGYQEGISLFPFQDGHIGIINFNHVDFETEIHLGNLFSNKKNPSSYSLFYHKFYKLDNKNNRWILSLRLASHQMELLKII